MAMRIAIAVLILFAALACTDARRAAIMSGGQPHCVRLFSGGQEIGRWTSTGIVQSEENSDGYFFEDAKTGRLVEFSGTHSATIGTCDR